jgi:hypothetical protein
MSSGGQPELVCSEPVVVMMLQVFGNHRPNPQHLHALGVYADRIIRSQEGHDQNLKYLLTQSCVGRRMAPTHTNHPDTCACLAVL